MQGDSDENHVILLYYVSSPNEQKVVEDIITAVRTFVDIKPADIRVKTKDNQ